MHGKAFDPLVDDCIESFKDRLESCFTFGTARHRCSGSFLSGMVVIVSQIIVEFLFDAFIVLEHIPVNDSRRHSSGGSCYIYIYIFASGVHCPKKK